MWQVGQLLGEGRRWWVLRSPVLTTAGSEAAVYSPIAKQVETK